MIKAFSLPWAAFSNLLPLGKDRVKELHSLDHELYFAFNPECIDYNEEGQNDLSVINCHIFHNILLFASSSLFFCLSACYLYLLFF